MRRMYCRIDYTRVTEDLGVRKSKVSQRNSRGRQAAMMIRIDRVDCRSGRVWEVRCGCGSPAMLLLLLLRG
jgi:hypothetical protein